MVAHADPRPSGVVLPAMAPATGRYVRGLQTGSTASPYTNGQMRVAPWSLPEDTEVDELLFEVVSTAGGVGSVHRIVVYADTGAFYPGALVYDSAGVATTATGILTHTPGDVLVLPSPCWVGAVQQGNPTPGANLRSFNTPHGYSLQSDTAANAINLQALTALEVLGVTGAPPDPFPADAYARALVPSIVARVA